MRSPSLSTVCTRALGVSEDTRLERARCIWEWISSAGLERGFPPAELLPAVAMVLAGCDQGGVPRTREHRRGIRPRSPQPLDGDEAAERGVAQDLCEAL